MYASFLVNSGRSLFEVQNILGHSDPKISMRYSHLSSKSMQEAANTASKIIMGATNVPAPSSPMLQLVPQSNAAMESQPVPESQLVPEEVPEKAAA